LLLDVTLIFSFFISLKDVQNDVLAAGKFYNLAANAKIRIEALHEKYSKLLVKCFLLIFCVQIVDIFFVFKRAPQIRMTQN